MTAALVALLLVLSPTAAPGASAEWSELRPDGPAGRRVDDVIVGLTFVAGSASLNAPGQPLRIRTGDTVVWTNLDVMSHDIAFHALPFSAYLRQPGDSAELTFGQPGHFTYQCNQHPEFPGMHGLVYVSDAAP
ncbi:MAG TPA: plastocyanin/azurin family copper-binding protein [Acidimicrobiia bacterium]|nr:plastocyanin/azurin family copper-binding protein [Acidimicrobiia bacterium]